MQVYPCDEGQYYTPFLCNARSRCWALRIIADFWTSIRLQRRSGPWSDKNFLRALYSYISLIHITQALSKCSILGLFDASPAQCSAILWLWRAGLCGLGNGVKRQRRGSRQRRNCNYRRPVSTSGNLRASLERRGLDRAGKPGLRK